MNPFNFVNDIEQVTNVINQPQSEQERTKLLSYVGRNTDNPLVLELVYANGVSKEDLEQDRKVQKIVSEEIAVYIKNRIGTESIDSSEKPKSWTPEYIRDNHEKVKSLLLRSDISTDKARLLFIAQRTENKELLDIIHSKGVTVAMISEAREYNRQFQESIKGSDFTF